MVVTADSQSDAAVSLVGYLRIRHGVEIEINDIVEGTDGNAYLFP